MARAWRETRSGSSPYERVPITGFAGSVETSSTGESTRSMSQAARRSPSASPARAVSETSSIRPKAQAVGRDEPVAACRRETSPPSSSIATSTSSQRSWIDAARAAAVSGSGVLYPNRMIEPRPASSASPAHSGRVVPSIGAISRVSTSRSHSGTPLIPSPRPG
jgi:hypothetical protein